MAVLRVLKAVWMENVAVALFAAVNLAKRIIGNGYALNFLLPIYGLLSNSRNLVPGTKGEEILFRYGAGVFCRREDESVKSEKGRVKLRHCSRYERLLCSSVAKETVAYPFNDEDCGGVRRSVGVQG